MPMTIEGSQPEANARPFASVDASSELWQEARIKRI